MENSREEIFQHKIEYYKSLKEKTTGHYNVLAILRLLFFLSFVGLAAYFIWKQQYAFLYFLVLFPLPFGFLVRYHNKVKDRLSLYKSLILVNEQELARLAHQFQDLPDGSEFEDSRHEYARDLDLFGRNSLFQLINRAHTNYGKRTLSSWFMHFPEREEILERQEAAQELEGHTDWRQYLEARALLHKHPDEGSVNIWLKGKDSLLSSVQKILSFVLPAITVSVIAFVLFTETPFFYILLPMGINWILLKQFLKISLVFTKNTEDSVRVLKAYRILIKQLEESSFNASLLRKWQSNFYVERTSASNAVRQLNTILDFFSNRANMLYGLINMTLMLDVHLIRSAEKWRNTYGNQVDLWFKTVGEFEAINSLSGFAFAYPEFSYSIPEGEEFTFVAVDMAHPLISSSERISNDFQLKGKGSTAIITGSNMSGKSTFLRTVGINLVLSNLGTKTCARELRFGQFILFTGMRTEDNLEEHVSSFYAELKRIEHLLALVQTGKPVMFMLDEILKGTNSADRHKGATALIHQLSDKNTFGFVSTHDLDLGKVAEANPKFHNYSFNSTIQDDKILFDYKITEGVCKSFNASQLMKNIGIHFQD